MTCHHLIRYVLSSAVGLPKQGQWVVEQVDLMRRRLEPKYLATKCRCICISVEFVMAISSNASHICSRRSVRHYIPWNIRIGLVLGCGC